MIFVLLIHRVVLSDNVGAKVVAIDELVWICTWVKFKLVTCIVSSMLTGIDRASIWPWYVACAPLNIQDSAIFCWVLSIGWYPIIKTDDEIAKTIVTPIINQLFPILN